MRCAALEKNENNNFLKIICVQQQLGKLKRVSPAPETKRPYPFGCCVMNET
jgi:hypothetical protein